jgi:hypothetical protein
MKKTNFLVVFLVGFTFLAKAQNYKTAAGVRLGPNTAAISGGFTAKHFINENTALEGIIGINNGLGICGLYEKHFNIEAVNNLQWFAGFGGYVAFNSNNTFIGGAGIVGLDYKFEEIPLNLSLDWKPELNIISKVNFESSGIGLSARFTF